uniref:helix-turn-helix transcriptional regulator n=1 Tax=Pontibacterium sp. TaxID=2036026 RepID=UPI003561A09F
MSTIFGEKVRCIRIREGLTQPEFSELTGISLNTIKNFEVKGREITSQNLHLITNHSRLQKYALWLMTGQVAPSAGQVSPADTENTTSLRNTIVGILESVETTGALLTPEQTADLILEQLSTRK